MMKDETPRRDNFPGRGGPRNVIIFDADDTKVVFGFLSGVNFDLPKNLPIEQKYVTEIDGNKVLLYGFEVQGKKVFFYENVELLNKLRANVLVGSIAAILLFGFVLYFVALWMARATIDPIRKSEEYARSYNHHIAHELKTPLAIMRSDLELALRSPSETREHLGSAIEEIGHMRKTIDNLLFLAEHEAKKKLTKILLFSEISGVSEELEKVHATRNIHFDISGASETVISGDISLVRALLRNILENIYKYAKPDTEANIRISDKTLVFSNTPENPTPHMDMNTAFVPFMSTSENGHGLGLSIIKRICDIHGWKVELGGEMDRFEIRIIW